jgi:hypothetical protein
MLYRYGLIYANLYCFRRFEVRVNPNFFTILTYFILSGQNTTIQNSSEPSLPSQRGTMENEKTTLYLPLKSPCRMRYISKFLWRVIVLNIQARRAPSF